MKPSSSVIKTPANSLYTALSAFTSLHGQINIFVPPVLGKGNLGVAIEMQASQNDCEQTC